MRNRSKTDNELIALILKGNDEAAFSCLLKRYEKECRHLLYGICSGDDFLIDEAVQEIYIALRKALESFRSQSSFRTFFYRLARNKAIDVVRKAKRYSLVSLSYLQEKGELPVDKRKGPEELVIFNEELDKLKRVLSGLKEEERTILILKDIDGLSYEEIAQIIKRPVGTVRSRLHRTRMKAVELGRDFK